jgi:hypothetical protein
MFMAKGKHTGGRPPVKPGEAAVVIASAVPRAERDMLRSIAEAEGVTVSELLRLMVRDLCASRTAGASSFERQGAAA